MHTYMRHLESNMQVPDVIVLQDAVCLPAEVMSINSPNSSTNGSCFQMKSQEWILGKDFDGAWEVVDGAWQVN